MAKIKVRCSFVIEVEVPDDPDYDAHFDIEENHDPGTGIVGAAIVARIKRSLEENFCWSCPDGENVIVGGRRDPLVTAKELFLHMSRINRAELDPIDPAVAFRQNALTNKLLTEILTASDLKKITEELSV